MGCVKIMWILEIDPENLLVLVALQKAREIEVQWIARLAHAGNHEYCLHR
jgi:hypothetical protein